MTAERENRWRYVAALGGCLVLAWFSIVRGVRVPLLGLVDLGFHELGHLLTYPLPDVWTAAMGSITQVAVPLGLAAYFSWLRRDVVGGAVCLAWAGTSARDAAVYIADAPYERLELIGGDHDWAFVLGPGQLDALGAAGTTASVVRVAGTVLVAAGVVAPVGTLVRDYVRDRSTRTPAPQLPPSPDLGFGGRGGA